MCARKLGALLRIEEVTNLLELDRPCATDGEENGLTLLDQVASGAPLEMERLDSTARRLVWHRCLREHPLTPHQVKHVMLWRWRSRSGWRGKRCRCPGRGVTLRSEAGRKFGIGGHFRSRLLNLDVRSPSHRQWSELQHSPSAQHPYVLANQLQKP
jgi:hypothetical protein